MKQIRAKNLNVLNTNCSAVVMVMKRGALLIRFCKRPVCGGRTVRKCLLYGRASCMPSGVPVCLSIILAFERVHSGREFCSEFSGKPGRSVCVHVCPTIAIDRKPGECEEILAIMQTMPACINHSIHCDTRITPRALGRCFRELHTICFRSIHRT